MNIKEAKRINISLFLEGLGYKPVKRTLRASWFTSPLRKEEKASFRVNTERNLWYDYGIGEGGDMIKLCKYLYHIDSVSEILKMIAQISPTPLDEKPTSIKSPASGAGFVMRNVRYLELQHKALLSYLQSRKIDLRLARRLCLEAHYDHNGKHYFAIAFKNNSCGHELRNPYFKGCIGSKDLSLIMSSEPSGECCIFEGFIDFLSYVTLKHMAGTLHRGTDYIVLNSVSNEKRVTRLLDRYQSVRCFLDNDEAGRSATKYLLSTFGDKAIDESWRYKDYKDLNEYLVKGTF